MQHVQWVPSDETDYRVFEPQIRPRSEELHTVSSKELDGKCLLHKLVVMFFLTVQQWCKRSIAKRNARIETENARLEAERKAQAIQDQNPAQKHGLIQSQIPITNEAYPQMPLPSLSEPPKSPTPFYYHLSAYTYQEQPW